MPILLLVVDMRFDPQGAFHDLVNEIDDIPDKVIEEFISWIEKRTLLKENV